MSGIEKVLKESFGYDFFRPLQKDIITDMLAKNDILVLMPTGAGKSICYQVPALYEGGLTVIISPLISLIYDQIADLKKHGILAHYWCTGASIGLQEIFRDISVGACCMLYTTPESFNNNHDLKMLLAESKNLKRFIVDEVHCVSNWGHDFRSEYLKMDMKGQFPDVPICGFTATAPKIVQSDIIDRLKMHEPIIWMTSYIKVNISYNIIRKEKSDWHWINGNIFKFIKNGRSHQCGIIYCLSRKQCESLAGCLKDIGLSAEYYHASMDSSRKILVQQDWLDGKIKIIVATIAFALGINKPDVRYVIHTSMPNSVESYYQQAGRAGRDGKPSVVVLYYSEADRSVLENMIDYKHASNDAPVRNIIKIGQMYKLCDNNKDCIKMQLSNYLGEYGVKSCVIRDDIAKCSVCQNLGQQVTSFNINTNVNAIRLLNCIGDRKVDIQHILNDEDKRILNLLLNEEQIQTAVVGVDGKYVEYIWKSTGT